MLADSLPHNTAERILALNLNKDTVQGENYLSVSLMMDFKKDNGYSINPVLSFSIIFRLMLGWLVTIISEMMCMST